MLDQQLRELDRAVHSGADHALALRYAPKIRFDLNEPFTPAAVGYSVFRADGESLSFPREIKLAGDGGMAIEYAIWWDWDIQHLYELEHIWVHVDGEGKLVAAEASWHGDFNPMLDADGKMPLEDGRLRCIRSRANTPSRRRRHGFARDKRRPAPAAAFTRARWASMSRLCIKAAFESAHRKTIGWYIPTLSAGNLNRATNFPRSST